MSFWVAPGIIDETETASDRHKVLARHPRYGWSVNAERMSRLWRREGLKVTRKRYKNKTKGGSKNRSKPRLYGEIEQIFNYPQPLQTDFLDD